MEVATVRGGGCNRDSQVQYGDALDLGIDSHLVEESHDLGLQLLRVLAELQHAEEPSIVSR